MYTKNDHLIGYAGADVSKNQVIIFKKRFNANKGSILKISIFADARYKLYLNGIFADVGPTKGNDKEFYRNEIDLSKHLLCGTNEIEVRVLKLAPFSVMGHHLYFTSLPRIGCGGLEIIGELDGEPFFTDDTWKCAVNEGVEFLYPDYAYDAGLPEHITSKAYNNLKWEKAAVYADGLKIRGGEKTLWYTQKSPIPPMKLEEKQINVKPNEAFDFGYLTTAYLKIKCRGKGTLKLTYIERYKNENEDRADSRGKVYGDFDLIEVDGELTFEPFWFRCFRFISVEMSENVEITEAAVYETGYPTKFKDNYDFCNEADNKLWEMSRRTLERCMQDTFTDCPYYEQLQYAMDTYLQSVYAYQTMSDDRLQRRAIKDFASSISPEGLTQSRSPSIRKQYIPCFSLYYIMMVLEHFERFADIDLLEENIPHMLSVLNWYEKHSTAEGLVLKTEFWHFIDWSPNFKDYHGAPPYEENATLGIESLMVSYVLKRFSNDLKNTKYNGLCDMLFKKAALIDKAANEKYYSEEIGAYSSTEHKKIFDQHMQIWAVLSGCAEGERAESIMKKSFEFEGSQATFAYAYFLFRALEKTGLYHMREPLLDDFRRLTSLNCTTVPETPTKTRSECHAWGAVALYEFTAMDLGVKQCGNKIVIKPYTKARSFATGSVMTAYGEVFVEWTKSVDGKLNLKYKAPEGIEIIID